jgi:hypothetical protein
MTNLTDVRNEQTQEIATYDKYPIAVQGAQQHIVQKQEQLIDQIAQQPKAVLRVAGGTP